MYNYVFLVGRLVKDVEVNKYGNDKNVCTITLAVQRPFKNAETSNFDTDFVNVVLWDPYCMPVKEYCHKGDVVGIKGRLSIKTLHLENDEVISVPEVIGEKVIFLSSNKNTSD